MKAVVDKDLCTGCSLCESSCPDVYEMQDAVAVAKVDVVPDSAKECAKQAADDCPVDAIKIEE